jgi:hypothetical protein
MWGGGGDEEEPLLLVKIFFNFVAGSVKCEEHKNRQAPHSNTCFHQAKSDSFKLFKHLFLGHLVVF